jgi:hypothetical protein
MDNTAVTYCLRGQFPRVVESTLVSEVFLPYEVEYVEEELCKSDFV